MTFTFAAAFLLGGCARLDTSSSRSASLLWPQRVSEILASPHRSAADRINDQRRKPEQMLAFIGLRPGLVALDLSAGGGYTTELLARSVGPSGGSMARVRRDHRQATSSPSCSPQRDRIGRLQGRAEGNFIRNVADPRLAAMAGASQGRARAILGSIEN